MNEWVNLLEEAVKVNEKLKDKDLSNDTIELIQDSVDELFSNLKENEDLFFHILNKIDNKRIKEISVNYGKEIVFKKYETIIPYDVLHNELRIKNDDFIERDLYTIYKNSSFNFKKYIKAINVIPKKNKQYISQKQFDTEEGIYLIKNKIEKQERRSRIFMFILVPSVLYFFISFYLFIFHGFFGYTDFLTGFWELLFFKL